MNIKIDEVKQMYHGDETKIVPAPMKAYKKGIIIDKDDPAIKVEVVTGRNVTFKTHEDTEYSDVVITKIAGKKLTVEDDEGIEHTFPVDQINLDTYELISVNPLEEREVDENEEDNTDDTEEEE